MDITGPKKSLAVVEALENGLLVSDGQSIGWIDILNVSWSNSGVSPPDEYVPGMIVEAIVYHIAEQEIVYLVPSGKEYHYKFYASIKHVHPEENPFSSENNTML